MTILALINEECFSWIVWIYVAAQDTEVATYVWIHIVTHVVHKITTY